MEKLAKKFKHGRCIAAPQGYAILPVSIGEFEEELDALDIEHSEARSELPVPTSFSRHLIHEVANASRGASLAIIETDYFGGAGGQGAGVLAGGEWVMPWTWSSTDDQPQPEIGPISRALMDLGVHRHGSFDEFEALELGQYRDFADFE